MNRTKIPYVKFTWNPVTGCLHGCDYCFARRIANRFHDAFPQGFEPTYHPERLADPKFVKHSARIFVSDMGDLFGEWVPGWWIDSVMRTIRDCPQHTFILCTKNPRALRSHNLPTNVIALTTVEDQDAADKRIPDLLQCNARVKGISVEPMLGPINLGNWLLGPGWVPTYNNPDNSNGDLPSEPTNENIQWVICGGETGPGARPMHPDWTRSLRDQTTAAGVKFFFKQWGSGAEMGSGLPGHPRKEAGYDFSNSKGGRLLDGRTWDEIPEVPHA